ncbi:MAG: ATP-binding protein [Elainellaceae cyanobacterium]
MTSKEGFPLELLNSSIERRIKYFEDYTLAHPHLVTAAERLVTSLNEPSGAAVIFLFGPTGVGETTLLRRTIQRISDQFLQELEKDEDKGRILFAGFEAPAPDLRIFSWKDFYIRALESLKDPLVDRSDPLVARTNGPSSTKARLRLLLEKTLQHRRPKLFFFDEAQNLGKVSTAKHLKDQSDCIKSISNLSKVPILLVGTYELLYLRNLSAQLCRRSTDVHYPRYRLGSSQDEKIFKNIVLTFQKYLPLEEEPDLLSSWDFCYERSLGCVGILKDWLSRTLAGVLVNRGKSAVITMADLEKYAYSLNACSTMLREIQQEERVLDATISQNALRIELGLEPIADPQAKVPNKPPAAGASMPKRVGDPKPKRRKVGDIKDAI